GRLAERRDHGVERIVLSGHEALPAHHGKLGALFRLPWRGLRPSPGVFQQSRPGQRADGSKRGAALKNRTACKVMHRDISLEVFWLFRRLAVYPSSRRTNGRAWDL